MAGPVTIDITGAKELAEAFKTLPDRVARKILSVGLRKAANAVKDDAKSTAPVKTGKIKKSIVVRAGKYKRGGPVRMRVVVLGAYRGPQSYSGPLELGHRVGSRGTGLKRKQAGTILDGRQYVRPRPFMRNAAKRQRSRAVKIIEQQVQLGIFNEAKLGTIAP